MAREIVRETKRASGAAAPATDSTAAYLDKLYKIVPAELTAAYLAISSFLTDQVNPLANMHVLLAFAAFLTILTPLYLWRLQNVRNVAQIVVSTISFPIWAICISTSIVTLAIPALTPQIITVVMVAWVMATPLLVPGK